MSTINERFKAVRKQLDMSMDKFGESLGATIGVIKNIEYNITQPKPPLIDLLCKVHQVDRDWLMTGEGDMFIQPETDAERLLLFATRMTTDADLSWLRLLCETLSQLTPAEIAAVSKFATDLSQKIADNAKKQEN